MFRRSVGWQVYRLLVCPRLSLSIAPVSSALQRYRSDGSFMGGVPKNRPTLATLQFDPPMACDILNSDLTRSGPSTRVRHVRQRVSLVEPRRGIWIRTSSRPREVCQDRLYHDDTSRGQKDISVLENRKRRQREFDLASQRLVKLMEYDVSETGISGAEQARHPIRLKVKRKKPLTAREWQVPNDIPSSSSSKEAEEFFDCQEPKNPIKKFITMIWESSKKVREQLLEGKNADLKKLNSTQDEQQILLYKNLYEERIQKRSSLLSSRSVNDNELQTTTINQINCPQDSSPIAQSQEVILSEEASVSSNANFAKPEKASEELVVIAPPKAPQSQDQFFEDSPPGAKEKESLEEVPASSHANLRETEKACEELGIRAPVPPISLSLFLRSREENLMNRAKKETIHRWRTHKLCRPSESTRKQMYLDAVSQYAIRMQSNNEKRQHEIPFLAGEGNEKSKAKKKLRDQRSHKSLTQSELKDLNSPKCKSDIQITFKKRALKHKKISRDEENLNQLKKEVYEHLWKHFDDKSKTQGNQKNMEMSKCFGKLNDQDELKFRIAGMISKCMFLVQNKMENESGRGIVYKEKDKDIAQIADDIWKHHVQNRDNQAYIKCEQKMGDSHCENESIGKYEEIEESRKCEEIEESEESKESEEQENDQEQCQESKEQSQKTDDGMKSDLSSWNVEDPELSIMDQVERVMNQCERLKKEIERRALKNKSGEDKPKPDEELDKKCKESDSKSKSAGEEPKNECAGNDIKRKSVDEVKEGKLFRNGNLETGLSNISEDSGGIMDVIIDALKKECEKQELREQFKNNDKTKKSIQTEEEDERKKDPEANKLEEKCEEALREEGEIHNECEDKELKKRCQEEEQKKRCAIDEERRKWKDHEKKCERDDEDEQQKGKEEEGEGSDQEFFQKLLKICEEIELKKKSGEDNKKQELAQSKHNENQQNTEGKNGLKEKEQTKKNKNGKSMDKMTADLQKNFTMAELKNWCQKIDRQKKCADEQLKKMREKTERPENKGKEEFSKLTWPEGLNDFRKRKTVRVETSMDGKMVFPGLNGIFRLPGYANERLLEPLYDPVPSVCPKLNGRDHRELSLRQQSSILYPGSTFPNNHNPRRFPLLDSNFFLRRLVPDLNPLSINNSLRGYWLRRTPPSYLPFCRRSYTTNELEKF